MSPRLAQLLRAWALRDWDPEDSIFLDHDAIQYLGRRAYDDYEPAQFDAFEDRLDRWLHNVADEAEQQNLFRLLSQLFFIGRPEFESLCRAAHHGPVVRWLVDQLDIAIDRADATATLEHAIATTWFCSITDSMRINSYFKVNRFEGRSHQPDWRSLRKFGDKDAILKYMRENGIARVVLLEDFVGSGTQMRSAVRFAAELSEEFQILVCPLVVCPDGEKVGADLATEFEHVTYESVLHVAPGMLIKPEPQDGEPLLYGAIRALTAAVRHRLAEPGPGEESYHGFRGTGAVVALYSNCPNNTLPIIRDDTEEWSALFPRIRRNLG